MAHYSVPAATPTAWQTLSAPTADAWLMPWGGNVYVTDDASPDTALAIVVQNLVPYPVTSGVAIKVRAVGPHPVNLRMQDKT